MFTGVQFEHQNKAVDGPGALTIDGAVQISA
jgi:hypothetical protein